MTTLEEHLEQGAAKVAEFKLRTEQLQKNLEEKIEEAEKATREAKELQDQAKNALEIFSPPGYIMLSVSTDYGDHTPYISWFPTLEDAQLYRRWVAETRSEWIEHIYGQEIMPLGEWIQRESISWNEPPEENARGKTCILKDLEKEGK